MNRLINASLLKKMFFCGNERNHCPRYLKEVMIDKTVQSLPTESMLKGSYFETLCLGSGAGGRKIEDLPRKELTGKQENANKLALSKGNPQIYYGEKTIDQVRIDAQATEFKRLCSKHQITVAPPYNTQVRIYKQFDEENMLVGELDIFPTLVMGKEEPRLAIIDLKLTTDLKSTFGEFAWGDFSSMDKTQGLMYHYLVRSIDYELNVKMGNEGLVDLLAPVIEKTIADNRILFLFWTFDYKKPIEKLGNKFFPVDWDSNAENELKELIRKCISLCDKYDKTGWVEVGGKHCANCPINDCKLKDN